MSSLYEIAAHYQELLAEVDETDEISEGLQQALLAIDDSLQDKILNIVRHIENLEAESHMLDQRRTDVTHRWYIRAAKLNKQIYSLKQYVMNSMKQCNMNKVKTIDFNVSIVKNPPMLKIIDEEIIPYEYELTTVEKEWDTARLREDLKAGKEIPGATLLQGEHLKIS